MWIVVFTSILTFILVEAYDNPIFFYLIIISLIIQSLINDKHEKEKEIYKIKKDFWKASRNDDSSSSKKSKLTTNEESNSNSKDNNRLNNKVLINNENINEKYEINNLYDNYPNVVSIKIYMLFSNIAKRDDHKKIEQILLKCINNEEFDYLNDNEKAFYYCLIQEFFRKTGDLKRLAKVRERYSNIQSNVLSSYNLLSNIVDRNSEVLEKYNNKNMKYFHIDRIFLNDDIISKKYVLNNGNSTEGMYGSFKIHSISGMSEIPFMLYQLMKNETDSIKIHRESYLELIKHSVYLEDTSLFEIIKSHFTDNEGEKIISLYS
tara:strand:- start:5043 stop:6002 length:960 start_codon:yes stop_codon:yes gene_type:complete